MVLMDIPVNSREDLTFSIKNYRSDLFFFFDFASKNVQIKNLTGTKHSNSEENKLYEKLLSSFQQKTTKNTIIYTHFRLEQLQDSITLEIIFFMPTLSLFVKNILLN